jgi:exopolysaccharide production protein ExoQ
MPPPLALALTLLFIGYLLRRDSREEPRVSSAVWIPIIWLMINGSRQVSQWWGTGSTFSAGTLTDGSPIDKGVYGVLMVAALCVLARRRVRVGEIAKNNLAIVLFLLYEGLSVLWSDLPDVAFKRWGKALGDPLMVLVLWSDAFPVSAITAAIRRCAYVLIPLSVLFCKYYDNLGRTISPWGASSYTGVTVDKNMFGYLLFAFGLFFAATLIHRRDRSRDDGSGGRSAQIISILFLVMIGWLFQIADSKTAALSLAAGVAVMVASLFATVRRHLWSYALAAVLLVMVGDAFFSVKGAIVEASGRDLTFTGRTGLWETLLQEPINPLIGVGYASFWLGERLARFWAMYPNSPPIEAHNGYLEVYLNLGLIGVSLIAGVLCTGLRRTRSRVAALLMSQTRNDRIFATFGMAYGIAYLLYNVTEATFQGLNFLFVIFLILAFEYRQAREPVQPVLSRFNAARWSEHAEGRQAERTWGGR